MVARCASAISICAGGSKYDQDAQGQACRHPGPADAHAGNVFDDAATGQGLLNFFLRGISCGALTEAEALATGLTLAELRGRSFVRILKGRRGEA